MIQIRCSHPAPERVAELGETIVFEIVAERPGVATRLYLGQDGVFYLEPVRDWRAEPTSIFELVPEAPGAYELAVEWRADDGARGWRRQPFALRVRGERGPGPRRLRLEGDVRLWVPSRWDEMHLKAAEGPLWRALPELVTAGDTVYDVGASIGAYSVRLARLAGAGDRSPGRVYCVEPSPLCVHYLRANLAANPRCAGVTVVLPTALLDRDGEVDFAINYGNANLGATDAAARFAHKGGHRIAVRCRTFDRLVETFSLRPPDVIKIDVEGVEAQVVRGMAATLATRRPRLLLELHGLGAAAQTLEQLDRFGYRYRDPDGRRHAGAGAVCDAHGDTVFQLIAEAGRARRRRGPPP